MVRAPRGGSARKAAKAVFFAFGLMSSIVGHASGQDVRPAQIVIDSLDVQGNQRVSRDEILSLAGIQPGSLAGYLDFQASQKNLWATGQFDDLAVRAHEEETPTGTRTTIVFHVVERPLVRRVRIVGLQRGSDGEVRDSSGLRNNAPYSPQSVRAARDFIQRDLAREGIPFASVEERTEPVPDQENTIDLILDVTEGNRVTVAEVVIRGNDDVASSEIVGAMSTKPEGFWWFRPGSYDPGSFEADLGSAIPDVYASHGYLDFRVLSDTIVIDPQSGKARLEIEVEEGPRYRVADVIVEGNQVVTNERVESFFQREGGGLLSSLGIGGGSEDEELVGGIFDGVAFRGVLDQIQQLYANQGYIFAQVQPLVEKRAALGPGQDPTVRIGVTIQEGSPAIVKRVAIEGNEYTHEWVIRDKIFMLPGDTYSQERLLQSYQSVQSLGFFDSPLAAPSVEPDPETGDVDVTFTVNERQTGSVNFGTSVGGGTGLAGFVGYDQPNLFGQAKELHLRWDFGRFLNNFTVSFSDPSLLRSRVSASVSLFNSTDRFISFANGRRRQVGASLRFGFPIPGAPRTRVFTGYSIARTRFTLRQGVEDVSLFGQPDGVQSQFNVGVTRSTLNHPIFPTVGSRLSWTTELNGGVLGGDGDFTKNTLEGTWWVPVAQLGDPSQGRPTEFSLGISIRAGAIFGDASRFPFDRFWMGGVQFGQPLRGYDETSVTPLGYFPEGSRAIPDVNRLGDAYILLNAEYAMRLNDAFSVSTFFDAGNIWRSPSEIDPTRLLRGAGFGVLVVTPFGPLGLDYAYGFDKAVPGWQLHFKMGGGL